MKIFAKISFYYAVTVIFSSIALLIIFYKLLPKPFGIKLSSTIVNKGLFYKIRYFGKEDLDAQMFILNHQSGIDIPVVESATKRDLAWVAKQELFNLPFFGLAVKLPKDIPLQRESKTALLSLIKECKERIATGRVVTIFPEGTRSRNKRINKFKPGTQMVANKLKLKVQPIVLVGTSNVFDSKAKTFNPFSNSIDVIFLDSFVADSKDKEWLNNLRIKMQRTYDEHSNTFGRR